MSPKIDFLLKLVVVLSSAGDASIAEPLPAAIRVPADCRNAASCGSDIAMSQILQSFEAEMQSLEAEKQRFLQLRLKSQSDREPSLIQLTGLGELLEEIEMNLRTAYAPAIDDDCGENTSNGYPYFWAPADHFEDGIELLTNLQTRAQSGSILDNTIIVETASGSATEQHLARCDISEVMGVAGPPRSCVTVAVVTPTRAWLRGSRIASGCNLSYSYRVGGGINVEFVVHGELSIELVGARILQDVQEILGMTAEHHIYRSSEGAPTAVTIRATRGLKDSNILKNGWRDALDFDVTVSRNDDGALKIYGTAHVLVCRQARGNLVDYSGPDDAQRHLYASTFNELVARSIGATGENCRRPDSRSILCARKGYM